MFDSATKAVLHNLQAGQPSPTMPVAFVGHGNPMNAINDSRFAQEWKRMATLIPQPQTIICMSAHWLTEGTYVTAMQQPPTIHDMYGFPRELYEIQYTAPGDTVLATELSALYEHIKTDHQWGFDHGAWMVLMHMYPAMKIPVLQLSIDMAASLEQLYELTNLLKPLRDRGVLFLGSGNIVHNLERARLTDTASAYDWALEFDAISAKLIHDRNYQDLLQYQKLGSSARLAIPTEDHYRPMLMTLALSSPRDTLTFFNESIDAASVSMRSFLLSPR
jgi:4,5-DOPA dioxygenase extradiol